MCEPAPHLGGTPFIAAQDVSVPGEINCLQISDLQAAKWGYRLSRAIEEYWEFIVDL